MAAAITHQCVRGVTTRADLRIVLAGLTTSVTLNTGVKGGQLHIQSTAGAVGGGVFALLAVGVTGNAGVGGGQGHR